MCVWNPIGTIWGKFPINPSTVVNPPTHTVTGALRDLRQDSDVLPGCPAGSNGVLCECGRLVCTDQKRKRRCSHQPYIIMMGMMQESRLIMIPLVPSPLGDKVSGCSTKCVPRHHTAPLCAPLPPVSEELPSLVVQVLRVDRALNYIPHPLHSPSATTITVTPQLNPQCG